METFLIILFTIALVVSLIGLRRNEDTYTFRKNILNNHIFNSPDNWQEKIKVFEKVSYERMCLDFFRPLKLETYWTDEEIKILTA